MNTRHHDKAAGCTRSLMTAGVMLAVAFFGMPALPILAAEGTDNSAPFTLQRSLDFRIPYPRFLRFRVGTTGATIDMITFTVPADYVGQGSVSGTGGDALGGRAATVEVVANNGQVAITPTNNSGGLGLGNGVAGDPRIDFAQIVTESNDTNLPAPVLSNAGGTTSLPVMTTPPYVTNISTTWIFRYQNSTVPAPGNYGTSANGGRVTYTAAMP